MGQFTNVTNRLDVTQSLRDTTYDKSLLKSRAIKKIPYVFTIPHIQVDLAGAGVAAAFALVYQVNYSLPASHALLNIPGHTNTLDLLNFAIICVRYREGSVVHRYRLKLSGDPFTESLFDLGGLQAKAYTNQSIKANFVIEVWTLHPAQTLIDIGPFNITTGLLRNPLTPDELEVPVDPSVELTRSDLTKLMPEILPTAYGANSYWLTN